MKRNTIIAVISLLLICNFLTTACISNSKAADPGMIMRTIKVNRDSRTFYVHLPKDYKESKEPLPMVIIYHGTVADANKIKNYTKLNPFADKNNFIVVYPEYMGFFDWNMAGAEKSKEVHFTKNLIDFMVKNYKVDEKRIYAAGYSSGANLSLLLACSIPDKIAAFASVSGNMEKGFIKGFIAKKPASILMINGTEDPYDKWNGNAKKGMISVYDSINFWKKYDKCGSNQRETIFPNINPNSESTIAKLYVTNNCSNNSEVSLLEIAGGGHTWPGSPTSPRIETFLGKTNYDVSGNEIMWDFFKRHKLG